MSLKINNKQYLLAKDYVYSILIFNSETSNNKFQSGIYSIIKSFLNLFTIKKPKSQIIGLQIIGEFRPNGIVNYWLKNKCKTIIIDSLPETEIENIITTCEELNINLYKNMDTTTKKLVNVCIGPYWTNILYKVHPKIQEEILKIIENE